MFPFVLLIHVELNMAEAVEEGPAPHGYGIVRRAGVPVAGL